MSEYTWIASIAAPARIDRISLDAEGKPVGTTSFDAS